jgi:hypothetical protein
MKPKTVFSLAEAHKIGETLQRDIDVLQAEIAETSRPIKGNVVEDQNKAVAARATLKDSFQKLDVMVEASIALGEAIAHGNAQAGVDILLKRRNLVTKHRAWLNDMVRQVKNQNENAIEFGQVESVFARMNAANSINTVQIKVVQAGEMTSLKQRQSEAVKQLDEINREISSLNHGTKIEFNFKASILKMLGC